MLPSSTEATTAGKGWPIGEVSITRSPAESSSAPGMALTGTVWTRRSSRSP